MTRPRVTMISVFHNNTRRVHASLPSLLAQTYDALDIVVVDDGSTDETLAALHSYRDPRLTVISHENVGFVSAIRRAIDQSDGDFIAIHGSGDVSYAKRIQAQVELAERLDLGVIGSQIVECDEQERNLGIVDIPIADDLTAQLLRDNIYSHGEVMLRRSAYAAVGGYRTFFRYSQDYDLWLRLSRVTSFGNVPEVLYKRYVRSDGVSTNYDATVLQRTLAEFARQCLQMRMRLGYDWIDVYGVHAGAMRRPSRALGRHLGHLIPSALEHRGVEHAAFLAEVALAEGFTIPLAVRRGLIEGARRTPGGRRWLTALFRARRRWLTARSGLQQKPLHR